MSSSRMLELDGRRVMIGNLDAVLWPDDGITKAELIEYYLDVAEHLMPFFANRPFSLLRSPDAALGESVYQKTAPMGLPTWVTTRRIRTEHAALGYAEYLVGTDRAALVYLLNLGYISHHPWSSTVESIDRPDMLLIDLDPTEIAFREVRNAAMLVRDLLMTFKIRSWVKTSGGAGLHVLAPLAPVHGFDEVLAAAETITRMARQREPSLFTLDMRRARRRGKILIDVHRNHRGATLVSPYAVREYPGAPVSTPLEWHELERGIYPQDFHLRNVRERVARMGDPLARFPTTRQSLAPLLESGRVRRARPMA
ncbi:MAG TPA: non-homologous end-joining DNA ligase [Candidatus Acidoferrum sp.]|nr:non-homologous end-joining DNA ligase [Candidatus Acidoferrum sp.]